MENERFFLSEIGSGFGEPGEDPHHEFPGIPPRVLDVGEGMKLQLILAHRSP